MDFKIYWIIVNKRPNLYSNETYFQKYVLSLDLTTRRTGIQTSCGAVWAYDYDQFGRRIRVGIAGVPTAYVVTPNTPVTTPIKLLSTPAAANFEFNLVRSVNALKDANTTIFESVYPPNMFMHRCGFERLKECNDAGAFQPPIAENLMRGLEEMHNGNWRGAADLIEQYEQEEIV